MSDKYQPPKGAAGNARKVIKWREDHGDEVKGMTRTGWTRARQLASGGKVSAEIVKRMAAFNRHRKNAEVSPEYKSEPWKDRGYVAWLGWGGTTGIEWAIRTSEGMKNEIKAEFTMNEFQLFGVVGKEVRASAVRAFLKDNEGLPVRVLIDSVGGSLSEGVLIYNMLKDHNGEVTTVNVARAYSIASYIFLAGSRRVMNDNALLMTHEARVDASALTESGVKQIGSMLSAANASIRKAYARVMGVDEAMIQTLWDGGSDVWYTSDQALESNLSTETIVSGESVSAEFIDELMAMAPESIVETFVKLGDDMSNKVTISDLRALKADDSFILKMIEEEATEVDALKQLVEKLMEKIEYMEKDEEGDPEAEEAPKEEKKEEADAEEKEEDKEEASAEEKDDKEAKDEEEKEDEMKDEEEKEDEMKDEEEKEEEVKDEEEKKDDEEAKDEEEEDDEEKKEEAQAKAGAEAVAVARSSNGQFTSASMAWKQQIADRCRETGCSSTEAVIFLNKTNPMLRQMVIDEANN